MPALRPFALVFGATLVAASCAPLDGTSDGVRTAAQSGAGNRCFFTRNINGFNDAGFNTVNLNVSGNRTYKAETIDICPDLNFAAAIRVTAQRGGTTLCPGDVAFIHTAGTGPQALPCRVRIIELVPPKPATES